MSLHPETTISTKFGIVQLIVTDGEHACISWSYDTFVVRGVPYYGSMHVYLWQNGTWNIGLERQSTYERRIQLHMSRSNYKDVSEAARNAVEEVVLETFRRWVLSSEAQSMLLLAQGTSTRRAIENRLEKIKEHEAAIKVLKTEIENLEQRLTKVGS